LQDHCWDWLVILVLRSIDRVGKGLRSAPSNALVADATSALDFS
jgi:hypothetical protein